MKLLRVLGIGAAVCVNVGACSRDDALGPPEVHYGRDECAECGMILSDDRFSAALLVRDAGVIKPLLFDDIGDMLDYERGHSGAIVADRYVHDAGSRAWVHGAQAVYVKSEGIHTPMGSGLAAFSDRARAEERARELKTGVLTFEEAARARSAWIGQRKRD